MKAKPTRRKSTLASISWTSFQHIVKLADAAQIPLGGGALSIANQLIEMYNVADDNKDACAALVETVAGYSETIWDFVQAMKPIYVKESGDIRAVIARNGIIRFGTVLDEVSLTLRSISRKGRFVGMIFASSTKDQLVDCERRLLRELRHFNGSRMNVLVAGVQDLSTKPEPQPEQKPTITDYQVLGAKRLQASDVELVSQHSSHLTSRNAVSIAKICGTLFHAKVDGRVRIVKMYYDHSGGKDAFQEDMMFFQRNPHPNVLGIYGYSDAAGVPLVVLRDENLRSIGDYWIDAMLSHSRLDRWRTIWRSHQHIHRAVVFLQRQHKLQPDVLGDPSILVNESDQVFVSTSAYGTPLDEHTWLQDGSDNDSDSDTESNMSDFDSDSDSEPDNVIDSFGPMAREMSSWLAGINCDVHNGLTEDNRGLFEFGFCPRFSTWSINAAKIPASKLWVGDFGVFVAQAGKPVTFQRLGNFLNERWADLDEPSFPYGKHQIVAQRDDWFSLCEGLKAPQIEEVESSSEDEEEDPGESYDRSTSLRRTTGSRRLTEVSMKPSVIMLDDVHPRRIGNTQDEDWVYDGKIYCDLKSRAKKFFKTNWTRLKMRYAVDPIDLAIVCRLRAPVKEDSGICGCVWSAKREAYKPSLCREGPRPTVTIAPSIQFGPKIRPDPRNNCPIEGAHTPEAPSSKPHNCCSHNITFAVDLQDPHTRLTFIRPPLTGFPDSDDFIDTMPGAWPFQ